MDDWELLEQWRNGDEASGQKLLKRYMSLLFHFFHAKVGNEDDVADLVSQTMLGCSRAREQMRDSGAFRSFLISCAMNKLRMYYRTKVKRRRELDDFEDICVAPSDDGHTPMSVVALRRDSQLLVRALKKMPLDQQIVFELKYFEDLNGVEIANLLGVPTQTVYTRLRRGTQKIRAMVAELAESPELAQSTMTGLQTWAEQIRDEFAS